MNINPNRNITAPEEEDHPRRDPNGDDFRLILDHGSRKDSDFLYEEYCEDYFVTDKVTGKELVKRGIRRKVYWYSWVYDDETLKSYVFSEIYKDLKQAMKNRAESQKNEAKKLTDLKSKIDARLKSRRLKNNNSTR